jgi:hypothetical protein
MNIPHVPNITSLPLGDKSNPALLAAIVCKSHAGEWCIDGAEAASGVQKPLAAAVTASLNHRLNPNRIRARVGQRMNLPP